MDSGAEHEAGPATESSSGKGKAPMETNSVPHDREGTGPKQTVDLDQTTIHDGRLDQTTIHGRLSALVVDGTSENAPNPQVSRILRQIKADPDQRAPDFRPLRPDEREGLVPAAWRAAGGDRQPALSLVPDQVLCAACGANHGVLGKDVPARGHVGPADSSNFCTQNRVDPVVPGLAWGYALKYHHVQLALKLARLGTDPGHLARLLKAYHVAAPGSTLSAALRSYVRPLVTREEQDPSFLLFRSLAFGQLRPLDADADAHADTDARPLTASTIHSLIVCPHMVLGALDPPHMRHAALHAAIEDANAGRSTVRALSCTRCPTDAEIVTGPVAGALEVRVWTDFGREGTAPDDARWQAVVMGPGNNQFVGPTVGHDAGSVKRRYARALARQGATVPLYVHETKQHLLTSAERRHEAWVSVSDRAQAWGRRGGDV